MIPAEQFEGAYRVMAQGVNEMLDGHSLPIGEGHGLLADFGRVISTS